MNAMYYRTNRDRLYARLKPGALLVLFSGTPVRRTGDEFYPFCAERNFVYLTGLTCRDAVLLAAKESGGNVTERLYILPPDPMAERWNGRRIKPAEAEALCGISDIRPLEQFEKDYAALTGSGAFEQLYLDLFLHEPTDRRRTAHSFAEAHQDLEITDVSRHLHALRTIKSCEEIDALRRAEEKTRAGILAMMCASRPGMYEYQYKAEFDHALGQFGPEPAGFPSIISAGQNNFCIHYDSYTGQALDGDMVLNDVGAQHQNMVTDVSRGWPCNGRFSDRQKILYQCALDTSNYMFSIIRPGMPMAEVDAAIRRYNFERLKDAGVLQSFDEIGKLMWHGGAHHIGYDVHDQIVTPEVLAPGMTFCVDVGIYHEEWGIGFRLEDNCLITENGCENLSAAIPRTIEYIEDVMRHK